MKEKANCYTDSRHKQLTQKLPRLFAFDLFYFVIHCDFGVVDMVATTTADLSGKTKRRRLRIKMAKFEETPPEVRTPENVEMRSASMLPTVGPFPPKLGLRTRGREHRLWSQRNAVKRRRPTSTAILTCIAQHQ